jgi:zinc transport system substrate-binding protein
MFALIACNKEQTASSQQEQQNDKLTIYTTIYPLQYFTERIGGNFVKIENVVPPGSDAHSVEITPKTMMKIAESSAFIHTGTGLEGFAESVEEALEKEDVKIVNATENVELIESKSMDSHEGEGHEEHDEEKNTDEGHDEHEEESEEEHDEHASDKDPHVWLDPNRSIKLAENIKDALVELSPDQKEEFENNFSLLKNELTELDSDFKNMVAQSKTKTFIVSHSAYGYWESVYGLEQIGISGLSPTDEPSQKQLTEVIELVKENELNYIFFEPNLQNKVAEVVKKETGTKTLTLNNLESITDENIKDKEDYFDIMKKNIEALKISMN